MEGNHLFVVQNTIPPVLGRVIFLQEKVFRDNLASALGNRYLSRILKD
jgi:hypothetical protein